MTDIYRIFEKSTRAITSDKKCYGGQAFDANTTTIHFQILNKGEDWDFTADGYRPFIVFNVYDQYGNPYVYGTDSSPMFSGHEFTIPYEITSQLKSARAEYQLWFVKAEAADNFCGTNQGLLTTDYLLSAVDGIAFKPSCLRPPKPCGAGMPYAPTTAPSTIGALEFMRENSIILPVDLMGHFENGKSAGLDMILHTLGGQLQQIHFPVATINTNSEIDISNLPVGNGTDRIPLLLESIGKGQALVFDSVNNNGFLSSGFRGARMPAALRYIPLEDDTGDRHLIQLIGLDGSVMSTIDLPIENVVKDVKYDPETKILTITFESGYKVPIPMKDLVDVYGPVEGETVVLDGTGADGEPIHLIGLSPTFKDRVEAIRLAGQAHRDNMDNPHNVTKEQLGLGNVDNTSDKEKPASDDTIVKIDAAKVELYSAVDTVRNAVAGVDSDLRDMALKHTEDVDALRQADITIWSSLDSKATVDFVNQLVETKQDKLVAGENVSLDGNVITVTAPRITVDTAISSESTNPVQNKVINKALETKQDKLVAGENIAITGNTITATLPRITVDNTISHTSENPVQNKIIARELDRKANIGEGVSVWKGQTSGGQYLYNAGDVVVYEYNLYVSKVDNNDHHPDDESCWNVVRSGALSSVVGLTAATYIGVFGNDASMDYTIQHNLGSRNLIYSIMTNDSEHEFVMARVSAPTLNTLRVRLTTPPGTNGLVINVLKARTATTVPVTEFPIAVSVTEPSMEWSFTNDSGMPLYAKAYDEYGNDLTGDIIQNSVTAYSPITVGFADSEHIGTLFMQSTTSEFVYEMDNTHLEIPIDSGKRYLVQCYRDGEGQSILDVVQVDGRITVDCSVKWKGNICLYEATQVHEFTTSDCVEVGTNLYKITYTHNLNRVVGAQVYGDEGMMIVDIHCPDNNTVEVFLNQPVDGELLVL